jgi:hypothetical protein
MTSRIPSRRLMSHWKQGCDDARAGRAQKRPHPDNTLLQASQMVRYEHELANRGYMNGYRFGMEHRYEPTFEEGSLC